MDTHVTRGCEGERVSHRREEIPSVLERVFPTPCGASREGTSFATLEWQFRIGRRALKINCHQLCSESTFLRTLSPDMHRLSFLLPGEA